MPSPTVWKAYPPPRIATPALVAEIDLLAAEQDIVVGPGYRAARLMIRLHGRPIGYADIAVETPSTLTRDQVMAALDPATIERAIAHLADDLVAAGVSFAQYPSDLPSLLALAAEAGIACLRASSSDGPLVTVAICTHDRTQTLRATLSSLARQTYRNFEVLVVDNVPSDHATEELIRVAYPRVRYVIEPRRGLNYARNRAIAEARGQIVAYIDDDAIADASWVQALVAAFDTPEVMCVSGLVAPMRLDTPGQELFERYGYSKGFHRLAFTLAAPPPACPGFPYKGYLGTGCNSAFRREVFDEIGLFDPRLDMGTPVPGGGDHDMFARVIRSGHTLVYDPGAVVFHDHIADLDTAIDRLGQYQESFIAFMTKTILSDHEYRLALLAHMIYWYLRRTLRGFAAVVKKKDRPFRLVLSEAIGAWRGPISLYRAHRLIQARSHRSPSDAVLPTVAPPTISRER